jgi:hypothetical protein
MKTGDCDEPDGDRPDERVARSGRWQDQDRRGIDLDGAWAASGVSSGEGVRRACPQALVSRRRGKPSNRCYPTALRAEVIGIISERYCDFGPTLAAEKLAELHGIHLARETLQQWMMMVGLWKDEHG